ncbi:hypothetical protein H696_05294 [Fonticula alba]|uniref:EGF-like domain-containing protein n=1 Tax=Fonticula alba TaxID=691883 RepID=A0A058Z277_FONAL|nr:hypothetical protein H696_05294 [Fonticula alba]KCV68379.1 hypothetical protein H696_05294 [Fonticula alba]|eukprot:XP_009497433.1 hypothetical protein H696_05294 [Fonticula alba]
MAPLRPSWRRRSPAILVALSWLVLLFAGPARAQDLVLYSAPHPALSTDKVPVLVPFVGVPSSASVFGVDNAFHFHEQNLPVNNSPEIRWGSFFAAVRFYMNRGRSTDISGSRVMLIHQSSGSIPMAVEHSRSMVAMYTSSVEHSLPGPQTELLAGVVSSSNSADVLGLTGSGSTDRSVFLGTLSHSSLTPLSHDVPSIDGPAMAVPGVGRSFYLAWLRHLLHISHQGSGYSTGPTLNFSGAVVQMAATRVKSPASTCSDAADVVLIQDNRVLSVLVCHGVAPTESLVEMLLPSGLPLAGVRILAAPASTMNQGVSPFYLVFPQAPDPRDRLWEITIPVEDLVWRRVLLPPRVVQVADMQLGRFALHSAPAPWRLMDRTNTVLLEPGDMGCQLDESIVCDTADQVTGAPGGWLCAPGQVESPYVSSRHLCAGCADGRFLKRSRSELPFSLSSHLCQVCAQGGCRTCDEHHCLVCQEGLLPEPSGPGGDTVCVSSCSAGFVPAAGVCRPDASPPLPASLRIVGPEKMPGLASGDSITAIGETWLLLSDQDPRPVIPATNTGPAIGALIFTEQQKVYFMPTGQIGNPMKPPLKEVNLLAQPLSSPVIASAELGPFLSEGKWLYVVVMSDRSGSVSQAWLSCTGAQGPCKADSPAVAQSYVQSPCFALRRLGVDSIVLYTMSDGVYLLRANASSKSLARSRIDAREVLRLPASSAAGARSELADWFLWSDLTGGATASPVVFVNSGDSRSQSLLRRFLPGANVPGVPHVPVLLARGRDDLAPELVFSQTTGADWTVLRVPGDMLPGGRSVDVPFSRHVLGRLPEALGPDSGSTPAVHFQGVALPAGGVRYPSALLLLARTFVGVSMLHCPDGGAGVCVLQPATFVSLLGEDRIPTDAAIWSPAMALDASGLLGPDQLLYMMAFNPSTGPRSILLRVSCPEGTYGLYCDPCDDACLTCRGPGPGDCKTCRHRLPSEPEVCRAACPAGLYPDHEGMCICHSSCNACPPDSFGNYLCIECVTGHVPDVNAGEPGRCFACDASCGECSRPGDPKACTSCPPTRWLLDGACYEQCPEGTRLDVGNNVCQPCGLNCLLCSMEGVCDACVERHFAAGDGSCAVCDGSCVDCTDGISCTACRPGLVFLGTDAQVPSLCGSSCLPGQFVGAGRCAECDASCELCAGSAAACQVCADGFRWAGRPAAGATGTCVPCASGCASCTADKCLTCEAGLFLASDGTCVSTCPAGAWPNGESCQPCDISCATCTGGGGADQCTGCEEGLDFVESAPGVGACVSGCDEGQYRDPDARTCLPCDAACATCNGPTDKDCWRCRKAILQDGDCVQACAASYVAVAGRCLPCHASCAQCMGVRSTECVPACPSELLALPTGASPTRCVPACPAGYHTTASGCSPCGSHCASCPASAASCAQCERGWLLASPECVSSCPGGSLPLGNVCATCHGTCATCYGPGDNNCLSCSPDAPFMVGGRCHAACPAGTHEVLGACLPCHSTCAACEESGDDRCTACSGDRALLGGECLLGCPAGFFAENNVCTQCGPSCATCDRPGSCTGCAPGRLLQPDGLCAVGCPAGWTECAASAGCVQCPDHCRACLSQGPPCEATCTACEAGYVLSSGQCATSCPAGAFLSRESGTCQQCASACRTCVESADRCTGCAMGVLLPGEGTCVSACPGASAPVDGACLGCPAGCEQCRAGPGQPGCELQQDGQLACPEATSCSRCMAGLLLQGDTCVAACRKDHYADVAANPPACLPCHSGCVSGCTGPEPADCDQLPRPTASRVGLAVGLSVGLLLLLVLLILAVLCLVRRHNRRAMLAKDLAAHDADATMLNTIVELALPGAILVSVDLDFRPVNEQLGAGTQASVYAAQAVGTGIMARLGCPDVVALNAMTVRYAAPEVIGAFQRGVPLEPELLFAGDIYSAAVMLNECLTRAAVWPGKDLQGIVAAVMAGGRPDMSALPAAGPFAAAGDLIQAAWQDDPARRPSAAALRQRCAGLFVAAGGLGSDSGP